MWIRIGYGFENEITKRDGLKKSFYIRMLIFVFFPSGEQLVLSWRVVGLAGVLAEQFMDGICALFCLQALTASNESRVKFFTGIIGFQGPLVRFNGHLPFPGFFKMIAQSADHNDKFVS